MADKTLAIGPKGSIKKKLHDNLDGTYSDSVFMEGVTFEGDVVLPEAVTALIQGMDGVTKTDVTVDSDGHLQVDVADAVTIISDDLEYIAAAVTAEGHVLADVLSLPTSNGKTRVSKRVSFGASETGTVVWTPTTGKKFALSQIIVSAKTAGDIQFFDNTDTSATAIGPTLSLNAGGGWSGAWTSDNPYRSAAVNNVLKLTTGANITGSVYVEGFEES